MLKTQQLVHEMMMALELPLPNERGPSITGLTRLNFDLLMDIVKEEAQEFHDEMDRLFYLIKLKRTGGCPRDEEVVEQWAKVIDAICDTIVTLHNTTCAMGVDLEPFYDEVHRTNMAKVGGGKRADGKAMKPEGWTGPKIKEMLQDLLARPRVAYCCHVGCNTIPKYGILKAGSSSEMHFHSCSEHLVEFIEEASMVWCLTEEELRVRSAKSTFACPKCGKSMMHLHDYAFMCADCAVKK